jgi:hypothetical protein
MTCINAKYSWQRYIQTYTRQTAYSTYIRSGRFGASRTFRKSELNTGTVGCVGVYMAGNPVAVQAATNWNLIGRGMTAPPPVLSPNSTVPFTSQYCHSCKEKSFAHFENVILVFFFFYFFLNCLFTECLSVCLPLTCFDHFNHTLNTSYYKARMLLSVYWLGYGLDNAVIFWFLAGFSVLATLYRPAVRSTHLPTEWVPRG